MRTLIASAIESPIASPKGCRTPSPLTPYPLNVTEVIHQRVEGDAPRDPANLAAEPCPAMNDEGSR